MMASLATLAAVTRGRAFGGVAAELGLQLDEVGEDVGLAAHHRRRSSAAGSRWWKSR